MRQSLRSPGFSFPRLAPPLNRRISETSASLRHLHTNRQSVAEQRVPRRLSAIWVPSGGLSARQDAHSRLVSAGFLRQSDAGVFHMLPLGQRVQEKLEALLDRHMQGLGASRLSLSSITTKKLWERSGRYSRLGSELFNFQDRRGAEYMLSPTHEEEITSLVANSVKSYKELPLRLYQITRKYRDELRPRHGLLRTREFTMKDMYTFDATVESALGTYAEVQAAYAGFFGALKLPFVRAQASSGDMGGDLSHEYHLLTPAGEDTVMACSECNYAANAEVIDSSVSASDSEHDKAGHDKPSSSNETCPQCDKGTLRAEKALEVGHTFHLGTRYSLPLGALVATHSGGQGVQQLVPMQMGCHGIGVSRLIGAIAEHGVGSRGLRWPRVIAPHEVVVVHAEDFEHEAVKLYDEIAYSRADDTVDVVLDDRRRSLPWKLRDADSVGYPVIVVVGKAWKEAGLCEIQCHPLGVVEQVKREDVAAKVLDLLQHC